MDRSRTLRLVPFESRLRPILKVMPISQALVRRASARSSMPVLPDISGSRNVTDLFRKVIVAVRRSRERGAGAGCPGACGRRRSRWVWNGGAPSTLRWKSALHAAFELIPAAEHHASVRPLVTQTHGLTGRVLDCPRAERMVGERCLEQIAQLLLGDMPLAACIGASGEGLSGWMINSPTRQPGEPFSLSSIRPEGLFLRAMPTGPRSLHT